MDDAAGPGFSKGDSAGTSAGTRGDADEIEEAKGEINITMPDKTHKTPILVSY